MYYRVEKSGCVFEEESYRVRIDGKSVVKKRKKCIGKMGENNEIIPNAYYSERLAKEELERKLAEISAELKGEAVSPKREKETKEIVSKRKKEGLSYAISCILDNLGIKDSLLSQFGEEKAKLLISTIQYLIATECGAVDDFCYFDAECTHEYGSDISSPAFSRLFASVSEDDIDSFFKKLQIANSRREGAERGVPYYASFDSTAFSSYSEDIDLVEASKGKQDPDLDHFALAAIYNSKTNNCGYYRLYRGNIPDVSTVRDLVKVLASMGYSFAKRLLFDRGYGSITNIFLVHKELGSDIMVMLKSRTSIYTKAIESAGTVFKNDSACYIPGQEVYATSVVEDIKVTDEDKREYDIHAHVHVYYSPERYSKECENLEAEIDFEIERVSSLLRSKEVSIDSVLDKAAIKSSLRKCIKVTKSSNRTVVLSKDPEEVNRRLSKAGYFCILTTELLDAKTTLSIYRGRDGVERLFNIVKNALGFTRANVKNDDTLQGKVFCVMLSGMVINFIKNCLKENRQVFTRKLTYNKLRKELEGIYSYNLKGKKNFCEISDRQKLILEKLGIEVPFLGTEVKTKRITKKKRKD